MNQNEQGWPRKNIVLCSDGTGNSGGKGQGTNVWRIFKAVDRHGHLADPDAVRQLAFYDDGVGSEDFKLFRALGGAFGWGLGRNICQLYYQLAESYDPGDQIYLFGFSRGAYTVRLLAGMIVQCGVLRCDGLDPSVAAERVEVLYRLYRRGETTEINHLGMKGVGELGTNGGLAPFMLALYDAMGTDAVEMPATPEKIWRALQAR